MREEENNVTGNTSAGGKRKRGQRGPTLAKSTANLKAGEKYSFIVNKYNQSCERYSTTKLSTWIGVLARDNKKFPLKYKDWRKMPQKYKEDGWIDIKSKFDIQDGSKQYVLTRFNERWKEYKHTLKRNYYDMYDSVEERMANIDVEKLPKEDWEKLFHMWDNEDFKAICERNRRHQEQHKLRHTTGNTSFAVVSATLETEDPTGEPPSRIQMFEATHVSRRTGQCANEHSADILGKLKEKLGEKTKEEQADKIVHESVFKEVFGPDSHGRVPLYGSGVKPKDVYGTKAKQIQMQDEKIKKLEEALRAQGEFIKEMSTQLRSVTELMHASQLQSQSSSETQPPSQTQ